MNKKNKKIKTPWPTKAAMEQIYEMKLWGGGQEFNFYSGQGSHEPEIVTPYLKTIIAFFKSFKAALTVCDLGCGDFNIGKNLVSYTKKYHAIDIVAPLIAYNKEKFKEERLEFHCLDIATNQLPSGDCIILRQVLQHLSNDEVARVLHRITKFKYIILTEHLPNNTFEPNKDIISGQGIRLKKQSGLDILAAPFNFKIKEKKELLSVSLNNNKEVIVTTLYTVF